MLSDKLAVFLFRLTGVSGRNGLTLLAKLMLLLFELFNSTLFLGAITLEMAIFINSCMAHGHCSRGCYELILVLNFQRTQV